MEENNEIMTELLPLLALRGLSVYPNMLLNFDVERAMSTGALDAASNGDRKIFLIAQKDIQKDNPGQNDLYKVGTICYIKQVLKIPGGNEGAGRREMPRTPHFHARGQEILYCRGRTRRRGICIKTDCKNRSDNEKGDQSF